MSYTTGSGRALANAGLTHTYTVIFISTVLRSLLASLAERGCNVAKSWRFEVVLIHGSRSGHNHRLCELIEIHVRPIPANTAESSRAGEAEGPHDLPANYEPGALLTKFAPDFNSRGLHVAVWQQVDNPAAASHHDDAATLAETSTRFVWRWFMPHGYSSRTVVQAKEDLMAYWPENTEFDPGNPASPKVNVDEYIVVQFHAS